MKIFILLCDEIDSDRQDLIDEFGTYFEMYTSFFNRCLDLAGINDKEIEVFKIYNGEFPPDQSKPDLAVTSGSRLDAHSDEAPVKELRTLIKYYYSEGVKQIGICFGHQALAIALGGESSRASIGWTMGLDQVTQAEKPEWLNTQIHSPGVVYSCQDQVSKLPPGASLFLTASRVRMAGFFISDKVLCMQGHPEFSNGYGLALLKRRLDQKGISEEFYNVCVASLEQEADTEVFMSIFADFIRSFSN